MALVLALVLAMFVAYASAYRWFCDDAFISFRYARNLVHGHGLVFNVGERVEGYTNFLWVLELAALWKVFGALPEHSSLPLTWLYTAGTLFVTARLALRTPFPEQRQIAMVGALLLLTINRNFVVWTGGGLETRQFTFFVVLAVALLQRDQSSSRFRTYVPASLSLAAAELTRPEGMLIFGCGGLWLLLGCVVQRSFRLRALFGYALPFALVASAHYLFRYAYYGDFFPNTYYAKDVRPWPEAGARYLLVAAIEGGLYLVLPVAALGAWARIRRAGDYVHVLSAICIGLHAAYMVRIGGDLFELRPLDFYWPLLSLATVDGLLQLRHSAHDALARRSWSKAQTISWSLAAAAALTVIAYSTVLQVAHHSLTRKLRTRAQTFGLVAAVDKKSFPAAFLLPGMEPLTKVYNEALRYTAKRLIGLRAREHWVFYQNREAAYGPYAGKIDGIIPADAVAKLTLIGVTAYHLPDLTVIDTLGLTDRTIARNPVKHSNEERQLAHDRSPPEDYLKQRGVNLDVLPASRRFGPASDYALQLEPQLWMPLRSPDASWLLRAFQDRGLWRKRLHSRLSRNEVWAAGKHLTAKRELGFFDDGLREWSAEGSLVDEDTQREPTSPQTPPSGHVEGLVNTYHPSLRDAATGSLTSPVFHVRADDHLVFLVGGGKQKKVGVELRVEDRVVSTWHGIDSEELGLIVYDMSPHAGRPCQLRIFDRARGSWGHVLADHFMLMRPAASTRP